MQREISRLVKRGIAAFQEGGLGLLYDRASRFAFKSLNDTILFSPHIPGICFKYGTLYKSIGFREKYLYNPPVYSSTGSPKIVPSPSDVVIEAGAFHGRDTAILAKSADRVVSFEPSPRNYSIASDNLANFDNVTLLNAGLWSKSDDLEIQYGESSGDDGFMEPDSSKACQRESVEVNTIEHYVEQFNLEEVDFLKVEAEGAEPEIIDGLGELRPSQVVINADEERNGESPIREIMQKMHSKGYKLLAMSLGCVLFFTLDDDYHYAFRSEYR